MVRPSRNVSNARRTAEAWARLTAGAGPHPPFTGEHHHGHSAYGHDSGDDDGMHTHPHTHNDDADHGGHDDAHAEWFTPGSATGAPGQAGNRAPRHIRFEGGKMKVLASARGLVPPLPSAPAGPAPGAVLDGHGWARSWGSFLGALRDRDDRLGARAACRKAMEDRPRNAMSERVPAEGGFLVPERLRSQVLAYMTSAIVRPRAAYVPMDSERVPVPALDNPSQASSAPRPVPGRRPRRDDRRGVPGGRRVHHRHLEHPDPPPR
jgi:hypothetical protein